MSERQFTVTKLQRSEQGYWTARVTPVGGDTVEVHRRFGSWLRDVPGGYRELPQGWPTALQERVRLLERRERERIEARRAAAVASGRVLVAVASPRASSEATPSDALAPPARVRVHALCQPA